ncbi:hypothetical protein B0H13DRAFT_1876250 [Mycena leptocephala]|nr:hypothetical protein B0H13DRAFT_1876250 [Mycena leptocephala]
MEEGHAGCKKVVGAHFVHWFPTITENSKLKSEAFGQYRNVISGIEAHKSVQESSRWHLSITCTTLEEVAKVVAEVVKVVTEVVKAVAEVAKVVVEVVKVVAEVAKVVAEVAKAITEAVKVIAEVVKVAAEVVKVISRG